jgi:hypothetical protein
MAGGERTHGSLAGDELLGSKGMNSLLAWIKGCRCQTHGSLAGDELLDSRGMNSLIAWIKLTIMIVRRG